jgi:aminoglycoside phosphotransferase (APT) family kinase protein
VNFATSPTEADVERILQSAEVRSQIGALVDMPLRVRSLQGRRGDIFSVTGSHGEFVVRFPVDEARLAVMRREEIVQLNLSASVRVRIPDTRVVAASDQNPVFAIHTLIPGRDWFHYRYSDLSIAARERLAVDLAEFMLAVHGTSLGAARSWLGIAHGEAARESEPADPAGKPGWFMPEKASELLRRLRPHMDAFLADVFDDTEMRYRAIEVKYGQLVFGHGDLHGGNFALVDDLVGPRLSGVFDFENAGVFDVHYDFGRLNLVDDDLQDRVIQEYQARSSRFRSLDVERIYVYSRAFILHLMAGQIGPDGNMTTAGAASYAKLLALLRGQIAHSSSRAKV